MNYTTQNDVPTAHITKKKSRLKIYNGNKVFLQDGENFEFELYNPKQTSVLAKIKLNGQYISISGIVLKPGQRVFLERFLDTNNKFEFSTYKVNNTSENRSAIDLNGDVIVEFYDEQTITNHLHLSGGNWGSGWTTINTGSPYLGGTISNSNPISFTTSNTGTLSSSFTSLTGPNVKSKSIKSTIETGRVEKGEKSEQTFTNSFQNFNYYTCKTVSYKILPISTKHKDVEEIRQYCTQCGTKIKKNYVFCPSCGEKL